MTRKYEVGEIVLTYYKEYVYISTIILINDNKKHDYKVFDIESISTNNERVIPENEFCSIRERDILCTVPDNYDIKEIIEQFPEYFV